MSIRLTELEVLEYNRVKVMVHILRIKNVETGFELFLAPFSQLSWKGPKEHTLRVEEHRDKRRVLLRTETLT